MSYKPEVQVKGESEFTGNALCFATEHEATMYVKDLWSRWTAVETTRVVESSDPVNYLWDSVSGRAVRLGE